ncbi:MAG: FGGY-family carbohydrate kinase [Cutibacterium sp.]|nr:FGGY-family carbohydrate kinase [Cutibacterium sp.]MDO4411518.1 FGGY-family carbohydrate kinase [Cutibacterium sp.]
MARASRPAALAFDLGSSSVRGILGIFDGQRITTREVLRVNHEACKMNGHLVWDIGRIMSAIHEGFDCATEMLGRPPVSIGVDTWGVDYGLIDHSGHLLRPPRAYRDTRMSKYAAEVDRRLPRRTAWESTGIQPQEINTTYQIFADLAEQPQLRQAVATVLPMPDLVAYLLGAPPAVGRAIGSSTGFAVPSASQWSTPVLEALDIPREWLPDLVPESTIAGTTVHGSPIIHCGGHDTACAVHALGLGKNDVRLFLSCGSWSLMGATIPKPLVTDEAHDAGLTNEVRTDGGIRILRNLTGLWLLQECQRYWNETAITKLLAEAQNSSSLGVIIDPDDEAFVRPGGMPLKISKWCDEHYGVKPRDRAQMVRLIVESLACAHADVVNCLGRVVGSQLDSTDPIMAMGGGIQNGMLMAATASACRRPVITTATEASCLGNLLCQFETADFIKPSDRTNVVAASIEQKVIEPGDPAPFDAMREKLREVLPVQQ